MSRATSFNLSLTSRAMLAVVTVVFLVAVAVTWFMVYKDREAYLADQGASLANGVARNADRIGQTLEALRRDVLVLAQLPPVQGIPRAIRNRGVDPKDGVPLEFWTRRLQEIFSAFAASNPEIFQVRYLGVAGNGLELVRVDVAGGRAAATPPEKLQSKGDRDYFQATAKLKAGEVYVSEFNLNQEFGKIQVPQVRTLRAATPVFTPDGELFGMVVINLDVGPAIDVATTNLPPGIRGYLANSAGDYLAHPDAGRTFGFDLGRRYTWQQEMPDLQIASLSGAEKPSLQAVATGEGPLHVAVQRVKLDPMRPERFLLLAWALPEAMVAARLADVRNATIAVMVAVAACIAGVVFLLLRPALAPLTRLTALAERIGAGRYDVPLPREGVGEVGTFVRAFGNMLERIRAREREVTEANTALQKSEARQQTVVENLTEGVAVADLNGQLLHFNRAAQLMHGLSGPDEYLRRLPEFADILELSMPDGTVLSLDQWPLARILRGEVLHDVEVNIRHLRAGWQRVFSYGGALARDKEGQPLMAVVTMRDITERKQAEHEIRRNAEQLQAANEELLRFNRSMVDRELRMIELKEEINNLCGQLGQAPRYAVNFDSEHV